MMLQDLVTRAAGARPNKLAVDAPDHRLTYGELHRLSDALAHALRAVGVVHGDRVATWHEKSAGVIGAMQAALRCGAAYVPLDPTAPVARVAHMLRDCGCRAIATTRARMDSLREAGLELALIPVEPDDVATYLRSEAPPSPPVPDDPNALAYILYTSGSTGVPKGVCISHRNALAFVCWAEGYLGLGHDDRLSNHAPFHFDLSVLDLYGAFAAGASVHVIGESAAYAPQQLVEFVRARAITVWYSVPSALMLMVDKGGLLEAGLSKLRAVVFAGEPYPTRHVRTLQRGLPQARLYNFYGPTETNVCTAYEVPPLGDDDVRPIPIGRAASGDSFEVLDASGQPVAPGTLGELFVSGPTVMLGYWGKPPQQGPYATGDLVTCDETGVLHYAGRRDHQVKVRGHRIELGEIEAVLAADPRLKEVAVVVEGGGMHRKLVAYAVAHAEPPSLVALKRVCAARLPRYMIIDAVHYLPVLPRTGNGKVHRAALAPAKQPEERIR